MPRLIVLCAFGLSLSRVSALTAAEICLPPIPCKACVDSHDFGYEVGDNETCATHWCVKEGQQTLTGKIKVPQLKATAKTTSNARQVALRACEPTTVTRSFAFRSYKFQPRQATVEVAFAERRCCVDACGCCRECISDGPRTEVIERDYHAKRVTRTIEQSGAAIKCKDVKRDCNFECTTIACNIADTDGDISTMGRKLCWTAHEECVPTGQITLTKKPTVRTVPVSCVLLPCSPTCVSCRSIRHHDAEALPIPAVGPAPAPPSSPTSPASPARRPLRQPCQRPTEPQRQSRRHSRRKQRPLPPSMAALTRIKTLPVSARLQPDRGVSPGNSTPPKRCIRPSVAKRPH